MSNMSFLLTLDAMRSKKKRVTRRVGWRRLVVGDVVQPVERCMGIPKGGRVQPIGGPIRVISVRREPLDRLLQDEAYGASECQLEGFPDLSPGQFVQMFCTTHKGIAPSQEVTRIEFEFLPEQLAIDF